MATDGSVTLRGARVALITDTAQEFVRDLARHVEGIFPDDELKTKYAITEAELSSLATNPALLDAVRAERDRRIFDGEAAREAAQRHFATAPLVLSRILNNEEIAPRVRVEAARELRQAAGNSDKPDGPKKKFIINIRIGGEKPLYVETEVPDRKPPLDGEGP
jgi:hypothetical protein